MGVWYHVNGQNNDPEQEHNHDTSYSLLIFLLAIFIAVFLIGVLFRHYCCCCSEPTRTIPANNRRPPEDTTVAQRAGLHGLTRKERIDILKHMLTGTRYSSSTNKGAPDVENSKIGSTSTPEKNGTESTLSIEMGNHEENEEETGQLDDITDELDDVDLDLDTTCAICLSEYEEGQMVLSGKFCSHMFHRKCAMAWLVKHDDCPYCRKEMLDPTEMRTAAEHVLSPERIKEMQHPPEQ